jgi:DnaK suppressor protein
MKKSELAQYKKALLAKKADIEKSLGTDGLMAASPKTDGHGDLADRSAAAIEAEISLQLKQTDAKLLRAINEALERIENGNYGICIECSVEPQNLCETCPEIPAARLRAVPWTKVCAAVKEKQYSG